MTFTSDDVDPAEAHALDPDWERVPPQLATADGTPVTIRNADGTTETAVLIVLPGAYRN